MATRYRAEQFTDGWWQVQGTYDSMTEAECALLIEGFPHTRVVIVKEAKKVIHGVPSPYLVHCEKDEDFGSCGESSYLTAEQYDRQMLKPDKPWACPQCGCYPCAFDDDNFEKAKDEAIKTPLFPK